MVTKDPEFLAQIRDLPCMACGIVGLTEAHHVKTRGSGGGDDPWNVIPLCPEHHTYGSIAWHKNYRDLLLAYPWVWMHLEKLGWEMVNGKLFNPRYAEDMAILKQKQFSKRNRKR